MDKDNIAVGFILGVIAIITVLSIASAPYLVNQMHSIHAKTQQQYDYVEQQRDSGDNAHRLTEHQRMVLRQILNE